MIADTINIDFFPDQIVAGIIDANDSVFITCKYKDYKWPGVGIFKRLVGYMPYESKDPEKKLTRLLNSSITTFSNKLLSGYKVLKFKENLYSMAASNNDYDVLLQDPRGFKFCISVDNFFDICSSGCQLKDGKLCGKFIFGFSSMDNRCWLIPEKAECYKSNIAESKLFCKKLNENSFLSKQDFKVGHVYEGSVLFPGKYMYMGIVEVYTRKYLAHGLYAALKLNVYTDFLKEESLDLPLDEHNYVKMDYFNKNIASFSSQHAKKNVYLFYRLDNNNKAEISTFTEIDSIAKCFIKEVEDINPAEYLFKINSKAVAATYDNLKEIMSHCARYNRIDLLSFIDAFKKIDVVDIDEETFNSAYNETDSCFYRYEKNSNINCSLACFSSLKTCFSVSYSPKNEKILNCTLVKIHEDYSQTAVNGRFPIKYSASQFDVLSTNMTHTHSDMTDRIDKLNKSDFYKQLKPVYFKLKTVDGVVIDKLDALCILNDLCDLCIF